MFKTLRHLPVVAFSVTIIAGAAATAQVSPADPLERSFEFVQKSAEATELFNAQKPREALAVFQALAGGFADLDEDGYVTLSIADCHAVLGEYDQARAAYNAAMTAHPELQAPIAERLAELDLCGDVSEATLERLRAQVPTASPDRSIAQWRLGRALQQRALSLLQEASAVLRAAAVNPDGSSEIPTSRLLTRSEFVEDLVTDLALVISQTEGGCRIGRPTNKGRDGASASPENAVTEQRHLRQTVRACDGRRIEFELRQESVAASAVITFNGRPLKLSASQQRLLERHESRINAILLEAAGRGEPQGDKQ